MKEYSCPLCMSVLIPVEGTSLNRLDGVTLYCGSGSCPAQEVVGHGSNEEKAFDIITSKYGKAKEVA
jgi:hypothetical protein